MRDKILQLGEVSERTTIPVATLRYWRAVTPERGPRSFKLGSRVVYKEKDVDAWIEEQYEAAG